MITNTHEQLKLDFSLNTTNISPTQEKKEASASILSIENHAARKQNEYEKHLNSRILARSAHIF